MVGNGAFEIPTAPNLVYLECKLISRTAFLITPMRFTIPRSLTFLVVAVIFCLAPVGRVQAQYSDPANSTIIEIRLSRSGGMSGTPTYRLTISGEGLVTYSGLAGV